MSRDEIRRLMERYFQEVWNEGRLEVLDEILTPDYVNHTPSGPPPAPGPEGLKPIVEAIRSAFPDLEYTIEDMVVADDKVAVRTTMRGTQSGPLFGMPASGKSIEVGQMNIEWLRDGRIAEHWRRTDDVAMMRQLGQLPG